jgi:hypothetical protein
MLKSARMLVIMAAGLSCCLLAPTAASAAGPAFRPVTMASAYRHAATTGKVVPDIPRFGTFQIHNYHANGKCIGISNTWAGDWNCNSTHPDQNWRWGQSNFFGYQQIINNDERCLGVDGGSTARGARIRDWSCNGNDDQYWALIDTGVAGTSYIVNFKSGYVIGVLNASTANGAELVQWSRNTNGDQYWF